MKNKVYLFLISLIVLGLGVFGVLLSTASTYVKPQASIATVPPQKYVEPTIIPLNANTLFDLVNAERTKAGVAPLTRDDRLDASAQLKANDMNTYKYFAHSNPTTGKHGYEYIPKSLCSVRGENISNGIYTDNGDFNKNVVRSWMESKLHHDAILNPKNTSAGLAMSGTYVVQHFCQ